MRFSLLSAVWNLSPVVLGVMYFTANAKKKRQSKYIAKLLVENRITANELAANGVDIPNSIIPPPASAQTPPAGMIERDGYLVPADLTPPPAPDAPAPAALGGETAARTLSAEPAAASAPAEWAHLPEPPQKEQPQPHILSGEPYPVPAPAPKRPGIQISAISVMLAVGAVLVIIAGLLFVRSNWEGLSNGGRLAFLGAGSMLFFGVSAMAHRIWKLERTGMAFFSIGAAFLPISIWAAGYFDLLGESLSGASNKWTITLAFAVFTVISLIAVRIYQKVGWGIASLGGISAAYIYFVYALTDAFGKPVAWVCLFAAVYALLLAFGAQAVREKLPKPIGKAVMPFACGFAGFVCLLVLLQTDGLYTAAQPVQLLTGAAALLCAACWLAPPMTNMMRGAVSIPFGIMCYYSFLALLHDLSTIKEPVLMSFDIGGWMTCAAAFCTMLCLILLLTKSVPDAAKKGFAILAYVFGVLTAASLVGSKSNLLLTAVLVLLFLLTLIPALKKQGTPRLPQAAAAISAVCICVSLYQVLIRHSAEFSALMSKVNAQLTAAAVLLAFSVLFLLVKRLHSGTAGLLLPVSVTVACLAALDHSRLAGWKIVLALCMIAAVLVYEWCAALWRDEVRPIRYIYAVLMPLTLFTAVLFATVALELEAKASVPVLVWSAISIFSGVLVYFTTRKQFHKVRRVMLGLTVLPPMIIAVFAEGIETGGWVIPQQLLCVGAALFLYRMFANRGFRRLSAASAAAALFLLTEVSAYGAARLLYDRYEASLFTYPVYMIACAWMILLGALAFLIRKRMIFFVGCEALADVMGAAVPVTAMVLAVKMLSINSALWHPVFFVYALGMCVLGWVLTKPESVITVGIAGFALILSMEAVRQQSKAIDTAHIAVLVTVCVILTLLLPYLGIVMREDKQTPEAQNRGWVMTVLGGAVPAWLTLAAIGMGKIWYSNAQFRWLIFFVPVLLSGYLLHFRFAAEKPERKRLFSAGAAAVFMIAMWVQPMIETEGTYWSGKLHLLPLIGFGAVIRYLYGANVGSKFLFGIGTYSMLRLGFSAMATEKTADLITVLLAAVAVFILSFWFKQKKWFLLGGISLLATSAYMHYKLMHGVQWWVYLLIIGVILIIVAGTNEMMKQRGESLKEKAGRFWQDWTW